MGKIAAHFALDRFEVGAEYSRQLIASLGGVPVPAEVYGTPWADGIVEFENAVLLLVTLEKTADVNYLDVFDGREFFWESQNRQTQNSSTIKRIAVGGNTLLFARLRGKYKRSSKALPFVYCGRLGAPAMEGSKPVTCLFEALDFQDDPAPALEAVYNWRPGSSTDIFESRKSVLKGGKSSTGRQAKRAKYWRVADAVAALGRPSLVEVDTWLAENHPEDDRSDLRENLAHLTVNAPSRVHYDRRRKDWRSSLGHERDRLFQIDGRPARYELYQPKTHGYFDLKRSEDGKWRVVDLALSEIEAAVLEAEGMEEDVPEESDADHDARIWAHRAVAKRQGQPAFRRRVLAAYSETCCVTGSNARHVLEAAHIRPYKGEHTNTVSNALLLRSDIHTLFDLGLLWVDEDLAVRISPTLRGSEYEIYEGTTIALPASASERPLGKNLAHHAEMALSRRRSEWGE